MAVPRPDIECLEDLDVYVSDLFENHVNEGGWESSFLCLLDLYNAGLLVAATWFI